MSLVDMAAKALGLGGAVTFSYENADKSIGGFVIDAALNENYSFTNSVTDIPVEEGVTISDHVVEQPDEVSITAFIGRTAFEVTSPSGVSVSNLKTPSTRNRIVMAHQELLRLKRERQPIALVLGLDVFDNMVITSYNIDRNVENGADLEFTMSFRRIKVIKSETTTINSSLSYQGAGGGAGDQIAGTANMGKGATEKPLSDWEHQQARFEWEINGGDSTETGRDIKEGWQVANPQGTW
jgi:hypothetical protein